MTAAIICRGLRKRYPTRTGHVDAVNGVDLEVRTGECFGLLGPNGAGKTTTIEILEGLLEPTAGEVAVLGRQWKRDGSDLRQRLGISLQETRLEEKLTVRETLALFRSFYERGWEPMKLLKELELVAQADRYVGQLSGGQRQRLAVACALVGDPELLFLDEPTTGLDPRSRRQVWSVLRRFRDLGRSILLTTQAMDEAERLCNRVAIVDHGRVIALGTPDELIAGTGGGHVIEFALDNGAVLDEACLHALPSAATVRHQQEGYQLVVAAPHRALPAFFRCVEEKGLTLARLTVRNSSLEDVFLALTGRQWQEGFD